MALRRAVDGGWGGGGGVLLIAGDQGDLRGKLLCRCCPRQSWNC